jgi:membrane fusion protein, multidrug efflux system
MDQMTPETRPQLSLLPAGRRRMTLALLLAAALLVSWWLFSRGITVKTVQPLRGDAAEVVYATGIVEPAHWAKVTAMQRKRIVELCDCEGRPVKQGDILARLDDVEERAVLMELQARLDRVRQDAARMKGLVERSVTSRIAYEEKLTQVTEAEARVAAQQDRIGDLVLRAPMDGIVLRRDGEVGEIAGTAPGDVLLWVGQAKPLRVVAEINEDDIVRVKVGQKVLLRHEGQAGLALAATVGSITPKGDPQTKTFRAYLALPDDTPLKIGMSVEANIVLREAINAILLPTEAVADGAIQVLENNRIIRRRVETGIRGTGRIEIRGGLNQGESVVSPFQSQLRDGTRVKPLAAP